MRARRRRQRFLATRRFFFLGCPSLLAYVDVVLFRLVRFLHGRERESGEIRWNNGILPGGSWESEDEAQARSFTMTGIRFGCGETGDRVYRVKYFNEISMLIKFYYMSKWYISKRRQKFILLSYE